MNYSALKRASSQRKVPELQEKDLEESFVRGSGPVGFSDVSLVFRPHINLGWTICKQNREQCTAAS